MTGESQDAARTSFTKLGRAPRRRLRKLRAILAGGLVFGIGASATLAAWTDTELTTAEFTAGSFAIEASVNGAWGSSTQMTFSGQNMYPGATAYAPVFIRTTPNSTSDALVTASGAGVTGSTGVGSALQYRTVTTTLAAGGASSYTCNAGNFSGSAQYVFGSSSTSVSLSGQRTATIKQEAQSGMKNVVAYCFEVQLPLTTPSSAQGTTAMHTWTWNAQSTPLGGN
ncbi:SipW-dependent-type signal peptide-containing protein [Glutamicibacter arilaitensis]|uniref:SipW-dependent-type signal peptide-containing protein n=1 Tax=Glutamicibacter arilaitensis TaxID=256701 RepID=UPI003850D9A7